MVNWSEVAQSVYQERISRMERHRELPPAAPEDPSSWPYGDETGPPYGDPQEELIRVGDGPALSMSDFTLGPREILCPHCWLMHRAEIDCQA